MGDIITCVKCQSQMEAVESLPDMTEDVAFFTKGKTVEGAVNEDSLGIFVLGEGQMVLAVADGMGGHRGAAKASELAIGTLEESLSGFQGASLDLRNIILDAIELANQRVIDLGIGAGTTLSIVEKSELGVRFYNIGDSGVIHLGGRGSLKYRSYEQSLGGFLYVVGALKEPELGSKDEHHHLLNYLGFDQMRVEMSRLLPMAAQDLILLASDGLLDNILTGQINESLVQGSSREKLQALVDMAIDNINHGSLRTAKMDDIAAILYRPEAPT